MRRIKLITPAVVAVSLLLGVAVEAQQVIQRTATWVDASSDEQGFRVYMVAGPREAWLKVCEVAADVETCTFDTPAGTSPCYTVVAFNSAGESGISNVACLGVPAPPGPVGVK